MLLGRVVSGKQDVEYKKSSKVHSAIGGDKCSSGSGESHGFLYTLERSDEVYNVHALYSVK